MSLHKILRTYVNCYKQKFNGVLHFNQTVQVLCISVKIKISYSKEKCIKYEHVFYDCMRLLNEPDYNNNFRLFFDKEVCYIRIRRKTKTKKQSNISVKLYNISVCTISEYAKIKLFFSNNYGHCKK